MKKKNMHFHHWLLWGVINGIIIYIGGMLYPDKIVLGNATVSPFASTILTAMVITLVISLMPVILNQLNVQKLSLNTRYLIYTAVNILVLWLLSRMALVFGFGLESKFLAITLGLLLTIGQYLYWEYGVRKIA